MNLRAMAIVLAGGKGTRLAPLTNERAKPAVSFAGKYRIVDFVLSNPGNSRNFSIAATWPNSATPSARPTAASSASSGRTRRHRACRAGPRACWPLRTPSYPHPPAGFDAMQVDTSGFAGASLDFRRLGG